MRPTVFLGLLGMLAGLLAATAGPLWGAPIAVMVLLGAALDALLLPRARDISLRRELPARVRQDREITVRLSLQSRLRRPLKLLLRDEPPACSAAPAPMEIGLPPHGEGAVQYPLRLGERGPQSFGRAFWLAAGPLHLLTRHVAVRLPETVLVYPDLLGSRPRLAAERARQGERVSLPGQRGQFDALREYAPGDPYRSVNWLASARRGKVMVNVYRAEGDQPVLLLVDSGRTMFGEDARGDRLAMALRAAFALADEAVAYGDRVGLLVYDSARREEIAPVSGVDALHRIARAFALTQARAAESDHLSALSWALETRARRSLIVWFTDLGEAAIQEELLPFVAGLARRHLVVQVALPGREEGAVPKDAYAEAATVIVRREQRRRAAALAAAGVTVVRGTAFGTLEEAVRRTYRQIKERGRL